jgi:hypothetical protein
VWFDAASTASSHRQGSPRRVGNTHRPARLVWGNSKGERHVSSSRGPGYCTSTWGEGDPSEEDSDSSTGGSDGGEVELPEVDMAGDTAGGQVAVLTGSGGTCPRLRGWLVHQGRRVRVTFLYDTGASHNFLSPAVAQLIQARVDRQGGPRMLQTAGEERVACRGTTQDTSVQLPLEQGGAWDAGVPFTVADIPDADVILGMQWGQEVKAQLIYAPGQHGVAVALQGHTGEGEVKVVRLVQPGEQLASDTPRDFRRINFASKSFRRKLARKGHELLRVTVYPTEHGLDADDDMLSGAETASEDNDGDCGSAGSDDDGGDPGDGGDVAEARSAERATLPGAPRPSYGVEDAVRAAAQDGASYAEAADFTRELATEFQDVFAPPSTVFRRHIEHSIDLEGRAVPPSRRVPRFSLAELDAIRAWLKTMLENGWITPVHASHGAPLVLVKKHDGSYRVCQDFRALNSVTKATVVPLPLFDNMTAPMLGAQVFSAIDLSSFYFQIALREKDRALTCFHCPFGSFAFTVTAMGLKGAPATACLLMQDILRDYIGRSIQPGGGRLAPDGIGVGGGCAVYIDDVAIYTRTVEEHRIIVRAIFQLLREHNLRVALKKTQLMRSSINFIGHEVGSRGVAANRQRCATIAKWPVPRDITAVRAFLGVAGYYRRFIDNFSTIAAPLTSLLAKASPFRHDPAGSWGEQQQRAFDTLRGALMSPPILQIFDASKATLVRTDASEVGMGAALYQRGEDDMWLPVEYRSKRLSPTQCRYAPHDREFLAVLFAFKCWRHHLLGQEFVLQTDNSALAQIQSCKELSPKYARWLDLFQDMPCTVEHRPGAKMQLEDWLSRPPPGHRSDDDGVALDPDIDLQLRRLDIDASSGRARAQAATWRRHLGGVHGVVADVWGSQDVSPRPDCGATAAEAVSEGRHSGQHSPAGGGEGTTGWEEMGWGSHGEESEEETQEGHLRVLEGDSEHVQPGRGYTEGGQVLAPGAGNSGMTAITFTHPSMAEWPRMFAESSEWSSRWNGGKGWTEGGFAVHAGLLFKVDGALGWRLCVPREARADYLYEIHTSPVAGHRGRRKTMARARTLFWDSLAADVAAYVRSCEWCQRHKINRLKEAGEARPLPSPPHPFHTFGLDFIGPLPPSTGNVDSICNVVDHLTGLCHIIACKSTDTAKDTADRILEGVVRLHGLPHVVVSDRDAKFTSNFWQALHARLGTRLAMSSAYHPQTDGKVERGNAVIEEVLRCFTSARQDDWAEHLAACELAINSSVSDTTGLSPFFAAYGFHPTLPWHVSQPKVASDAAEVHVDALQSVHIFTRDALQRAKERMRGQLNKRRRPVTHKVGDHVLLATKHLKVRSASYKLSARYIGPFEVTEVLNNAVRLALPDTLQIHPVVNVAAVRAYYQRPEHLRHEGDAWNNTFVDIEGERCYLVEALLGRRGRGDKRRYLVKWQGWDLSHCTWEPAQELPAWAISLYENRHPEQGGEEDDAGQRPAAKTDKAQPGADAGAPARSSPSKPGSKGSAGPGARAGGTRPTRRSRAAGAELRGAQGSSTTPRAMQAPCDWAPAPDGPARWERGAREREESVSLPWHCTAGRTATGKASHPRTRRHGYVWDLEGRICQQGAFRRDGADVGRGAGTCMCLAGEFRHGEHWGRGRRPDSGALGHRDPHG